MRRETRISGLRRLFHFVRSRRALERDVDDEIRFHIESRVAELVAHGLGPDEARAAAAREFGDVAASRRELAELDDRRLRRERAAEWWDELSSDVRWAVRGFRRRPGFTAVVLLTIALGIGATTAIFTVVDAALLRPLPYREPERLVHLWETQRGDVDDRSEASWPDFLDWRAQSDAFAALEGYDETNVTVAGDEPAMLRGARVTPGFLAMLGVAPALGRSFDADDAIRGGTPVVVVSHGLWERRFGGDAGVLGAPLQIDGRAHTVVGVLPRGFHFAPLELADIWLPLDPTEDRAAERFNHWLNVVGRLRQDVTIDEARASLATVMRRLADEHPETNRGRGIAVVPLRDAVVGDVRPVLLVLLGAAALVLLVACVNVASLLLARSMERARELAVRAALGASRARLARQLLVESLLLAVAGAALGAWLAVVGAGALVAAIPADIVDSMPYLDGARVDARVLALTAAIALATGVAFGLAPASYAARASLGGALRRDGRGAVGGARMKLRGALVVAQISLTVALLVGAGLMARSLAALLGADPGFDTQHIVTARVALQGDAWRDEARQRRFFEELVGRMRVMPGVQAAGAVRQLPLEGGGTNTFRVEGAAEPDPARRPEAVMRGVAGDYFRAMGIELVAGRPFTERDVAGAPGVLLLSESLARRLFGDASPLGERLRFYAFPDTTWEVVGVVADVKTGALDAPAPPTIYYSHLQGAENRMTIVARTAGAPDAVASALRREVRSLAPGAPVYAIATMEEKISSSPAVFARRFPMLLIGAFAATALVLAVIGIYGVVSYSVTSRWPELAVRAALGAQRGDIVGMVLREGGRLALAGLALGLVATLWLSRFLRALLYGTEAADPLTYGVVALLLGSATMLASWLPARRAARVDPAAVLRGE